MGNASAPGSLYAKRARWQYFRGKGHRRNDGRVPICCRELRSVQPALRRRLSPSWRRNIEIRRASDVELAAVGDSTLVLGDQASVRRDAADFCGNPRASYRTIRNCNLRLPAGAAGRAGSGLRASCPSVGHWSRGQYSSGFAFMNGFPCAGSRIPNSPPAAVPGRPAHSAWPVVVSK